MITNTYLDSAAAAAAAPDPATFREEIETARLRAALSAREAQEIAYDLQFQAAASEGEPTGLPGAFASREVGVVSLSHVQALVQENAALHYHLRTANATANAAVTDALALFQENAVLRERLAALESFHQRVPPFTPRGMPGGMVFTPRSAVAPAYSHECPPNPLVTAEEAHIRRMYLGRAIRAQDRGTGRLEERTVTPAVTTNPPLLSQVTVASGRAHIERISLARAIKNQNRRESVLRGLPPLPPSPVRTFLPSAAELLRRPAVVDRSSSPGTVSSITSASA